MMAAYDLEPIAVAGVEGIAGLFEPSIVEAGEDVVKAWIDLAYHYSQDEMTWAMTMHFLYLGALKSRSE